MHQEQGVILKFEDLKVGQRIRQPIDWLDLKGTVKSVGTNVWSMMYDTDQESGKLYSYDAGTAEYFEPIPAPEESVYITTLRTSPAVRNHGEGVSSGELADFTELLAAFGAGRIEGTGAEQYAKGARQLFEGMTITELAEGFIEEVSDAQNYLAMMSIKVLAALNAARVAGA